MSYNPFHNIENPELMGYEYAWVNFIKNDEIPDNIISNEILESWKRCKSNNLDSMTRQIPENNCGHEELKVRIKQNSDLISISAPIMRGIINVLDEKGIRMHIVDRDNIILSDIHQEDGYMNHYKNMIGSSSSESLMGTNSLDLAIRHKRPMSVIGAQHYYQQNHKYAGYSAPIFDPDNEIQGAIGIIIRLEQMSHYMIAMIATTAKAIEDELQLLKSNSIIIQQNNEKQDILDSVTDGIIYVDEQQVITHANLQFTKFSGLKKDDLIGQSINIIQTVPRIASLKASIDIQSNIQVKLKGKDKSYNCFLNHKAVKDGNGNEIWIFTATDEIQELADKINLENRAFFTFDSIIGNSKILINCIELAKKVAEHETRVIIEGESGTGKEMFAQSIHNSSSRKNAPFVAVDCGAIPRELLESEIFGYEEGAYTGARKGGHRGKFELSHNGTLFLDEIGNLPLEMQVKLLRVLQENKVVRIGGYTPIPVDVKVIAATNQDLEKEVESGTFREDLFYRLNVVHIKLPPLRERREDIPMLIENFINTNRHQINSKIKGINEEAMKILFNYNWPGNIRQLNNVIERMMILAEGEILTKNLIPNAIAAKVNNPIYSAFNIEEIDTLDAASAKYVENVVYECKGNIKKASEKLGISRATAYRFLKYVEKLKSGEQI